MLLGDEAIAQAAIDAGVSGVYAYPGTPSTEIMEYVQASPAARSGTIKAYWSANEKTAMETALGMSYAGKRALVCMKHVGLNVAADAFINAAITGANGGLVVLAADDPSMHSSQNEQDSRFYGKFALMPILEPSNQQQAYDMVRYAFDLSESLALPVLIRITTRLAHSRAGVATAPPRPQNELKLPANLRQFVLLPAIARVQYRDLLAKQEHLRNRSLNDGFNEYLDGPDKKLGIIACGLAFNYLIENFESGVVPYPVLKIGQYPLPIELVRRLYAECEAILVLEDGYPMVEELLRGLLQLGKPVHGRLDGALPRDGELNPVLVAHALGMETHRGQAVPAIVKARPPRLCDGCAHTDAFLALNEALQAYGRGRVFSDIGCYTLSALEPLEAINSCVDMGASITMAIGAADAGLVPAVAAIGDSTFTHSGMTGLLDAVNNNSPITVLILDNSTTGMTGGQSSAAFGKVEDICRGLGVHEDHIHVLKPLRKHHEENVAIIKKELEYQGVSVIIPRRECVQTLNRKVREKAKARQEQQ